MTAERRILVTLIPRDPFIIWRTKGTNIVELKEVITTRQSGEDIFIKADDEDLEITIVAGTYKEVLEMLKNGWKLDPFFHKKGRPWTVDCGHVWVLVKGTPEEIAELDPFVELPKPEITDADKWTIDRFAGIVDVVDLQPDAIEGKGVARLVEKGYEVFNILKGSVILVKKEKSPSFVVTEDAVGPLAVRNGVLMNCNVCGDLYMVSHDINADEFICPFCPQPETCYECKGRGIITEDTEPPYEEEGPVIHTCERCKGTGILPPEEVIE